MGRLRRTSRPGQRRRIGPHPSGRVRTALCWLLLLAGSAACAPSLHRPALQPTEAALTPLELPSPAAAAFRFQKGIDYTAWRAGEYSSADSDQTLRELADLGVEWIGLVVTGYQETPSSTTIRWDLPQTPTDADLRHAIARAHQLGMHVMLKPQIDLLDGVHWRGDIGTAFTSEEQWRAWFRAYRQAIVHDAELAQAQGVEELCIGTELVGVSGREADWRGIVRAVRDRYRGALTYASNHGEELRVHWWDAVDYIGVDAYYGLADAPVPSVAELKQAWLDRGYVALLEGLARRYRRPILFTEVGYRSVPGATVAPWQYRTVGAPDPRDQANAYQAVFETFLGRRWFAGVYWWNVTTDPNQGGAGDTDYTPLGKPAEAILKRFYAGK